MRILLGALLLAACSGGGGGESPTAAGSLFVVIGGGFVPPLDGGVLEATVLFDGEEPPNARETCFSEFGCTPFDLDAMLQAQRGRHTVSFQIIRHTRDLRPYSGRLRYVVFGTVQATDLGSGEVQAIQLPRREPLLGPGESISYTVTLDP